LLVLVACFLLVAYGTYLFLDSREPNSEDSIQSFQLSQDALGNQNELGGAVHRIQAAPFLLCVGIIIKGTTHFMGSEITVVGAHLKT
jgi:hypothetical protein